MPIAYMAAPALHSSAIVPRRGKGLQANKNPMRVALLSRNDRALALIRNALTGQGIEVHGFMTFEQLAAGFHWLEFDAILLEDQPDHLAHCLSLLQRQAQARTAIIVVGKGSAAAITHALVHGADDYVFDDGNVERATQRIVGRIGVRVLRNRQPVVRVGSFELDAVAREIGAGGERVRLTMRETVLARLLFENAGRIVALDRLCFALCGASDAAAVRSLNQHVYQLRRKLRQLPAEGQRLRVDAVYGSGYRLASEAHTSPR